MDVPRKGLLRTVLMLAVTAASLLAIGVGSASASSDIEGVSALNGGQIAIQPLSNGTFVGTVVSETAFAECPPGRAADLDRLTKQSDGSYWGLHQWYFEKSGCAVNPTLGLTAFRVLTEANGSHYLKVCLSNPGTTQPTITPAGTAAGATYGCVNSSLSAALPTTTGGSGSSGTTTTGSEPKKLRPHRRSGPRPSKNWSRFRATASATASAAS